MKKLECWTTLIETQNLLLCAEWQRGEREPQMKDYLKELRQLREIGEAQGPKSFGKMYKVWCDKTFMWRKFTIFLKGEPITMPMPTTH